MGNPFIGQINIVGFNFAPRGWALCEGQLLPINQWQALFSLLGTTFGGDGRTSFGLPDLRGRAPISPGSGPGLSTYRWGQRGGVETVTLNTNQIPSHNHFVQLGQTGNTPAGNGAYLGNITGADTIYNASPQAGQTLNQAAITNAGGSGSHENRMPFLAVYYCISTSGRFPSRN